MIVFTPPRLARPVRIAALLTTGLLVSPLLAPQAHAIIGGCGGDPIVVLSNGTTLDLSTTATTDASTVSQIAYTLHVPAGTQVVSVTSLGVREVLSVIADNAPDSYTTVTQVDASWSDATVTTTTTVVSLLGMLTTGSKTGTINEALRIALTS